MTVLDDIAARKRVDVAARARPIDEVKRAARARVDRRDFAAALAEPGLSLIAEIKQRSPSKGVLRAGFDPAAIARIYDARASAISVLCDAPYFGGDLAHLELARAASRLPLLAKDFVLSPYQVYEARAAGADAVLLIARLLEDGAVQACYDAAHEANLDVLFEVHDDAEMERALALNAPIIGINSRDLATLKIDPGVITRLAPRARAEGRLVVAESGVSSRADTLALAEIADAVLIGSAFMEAPDIAAKIEALGWSG